MSQLQILYIGFKNIQNEIKIFMNYSVMLSSLNLPFNHSKAFCLLHFVLDSKLSYVCSNGIYCEQGLIHHLNQWWPNWISYIFEEVPVNATLNPGYSFLSKCCKSLLCCRANSNSFNMSNQLRFSTNVNKSRTRVGWVGFSILHVVCFEIKHWN